MKRFFISLALLFLACGCSASSSDTSASDKQQGADNSTALKSEDLEKKDQADSQKIETQPDNQEPDTSEEQSQSENTNNNKRQIKSDLAQIEQTQPETTVSNQAQADPVSVYESSVLAQYKELNTSNIRQANLNRNYVREWDAIDFYAPTIKLGYALDDLNSDGISELLICSQQESGEIRVVDAFTFDGQKAISLITGKPEATPKGDFKGLANGSISLLGDGTLVFMDNGGPGALYSYYKMSESYQPAQCILKLKEGYLGPEFMDPSPYESVCFKEVNGQREIVSDAEMQVLKQENGTNKGIREIQNFVALTDWIEKGVPGG